MGTNLPVVSLESDSVQAELIRALAMSTATQKELAEEYGVSPSTISMFRKRHEVEITHYRETLPSALDDLWVTDKAQRIKALQADVELLENSDDTDAIKVRLAILKAIEESLGQLPPKTTINVVKQVNYTVTGVNLDDLS